MLGTRPKRALLARKCRSSFARSALASHRFGVWLLSRRQYARGRRAEDQPVVSAAGAPPPESKRLRIRPRQGSRLTSGTRRRAQTGMRFHPVVARPRPASNGQTPRASCAGRIPCARCFSSSRSSEGSASSLD
jgi:hypothetical protein